MLQFKINIQEPYSINKIQEKNNNIKNNNIKGINVKETNNDSNLFYISLQSNMIGRLTNGSACSSCGR